MNSLDIGICILLAIFIISGLFKGFIRGISSLVAIVCGIILANRYYIAASSICTYLRIPNPGKVTAYICVFLISYGIIGILSLVLHKFSTASRISYLNRAFGCALGFFKGLVFALILITMFQIVLPAKSPFLKDSVLLPYSNKVIAHAKAIIPKEFYKIR
jgi:membrane protein required for colicin V production